MPRPNNTERNNQIGTLAKRGVSNVEIAEQFGLTPARVGQIAREMNASKVRTRPDIRRLHARICGGIPIATVAKRVGLTVQTLTDMLHKADLWLPGETSPKKERMMRRIAKDYLEGGTVRGIAKRETAAGHKVSREEVRRLLIAYGVPLRPRGTKPVPNEDIRLAYTDYRKTHSLVETGITFDISAKTLSQRFKEAGLPLYPMRQRKPIDREALEPEWADTIEFTNVEKTRSVVVSCSVAGDRSEIFLKFSEAQNGQALPTGTRTIQAKHGWSAEVEIALHDRLKTLGAGATGRRGIKLLLAGLARAIGEK